LTVKQDIDKTQYCYLIRQSFFNLTFISLNDWGNSLSTKIMSDEKLDSGLLLLDKN
jgi:hypothetical protein